MTHVSQKDRILALLQRGEVTNRELNMIGHRFGVRLHELRAEGHDIRCSPVKGKSGLNRYRLERE